MANLIILLLASILGLSYTHLFGGFNFSAKICLFAGLTLIAPILLKFHLKDFLVLLDNKIILLKNLVLNFAILPIVAIGLGMLFQDYGIAGAMLILSLLSGGGMVMLWVKNSGANIKLGFSIFTVNLLLIGVAFLMMEWFAFSDLSFDYYEAWFDTILPNISPTEPLMPLLIIPLVVTRILLFALPKLSKKIIEFSPKITKVAVFTILFYLFALKSSQQLFDLELLTIIKSFVAVVLFYLIIYGIGYLAYGQDANNKAAFWLLVTRFVTLALVYTLFLLNSFGISMLFTVMLAYLIQNPMAVVISNLQSKLSNNSPATN